MDQLKCNLKIVLSLFKAKDQNFPISVRDLSGWIFAVGILIACAAWKLHWVENLITSILSIVILLFAAISVSALVISQFIFRKEPRNDSLWAQFHNTNQ